MMNILTHLRYACLLCPMMTFAWTASTASAQIVHVDPALGVNTNPGTATLPFKTLRRALNYAAATPLVTEIRLAEGTYRPGTSLSDSFELLDGVDVLGGYQSGSAFGVRSPATHVSVLSGEIGGPGPYDNCLTVVRAENVAGVTLSGFTIRGGYGSYSGGGLYLRNASITVGDCIIEDNQASNGGGAYLDDELDVWFYRCTFRRNTATQSGGAIAMSSTSNFPHALVSQCRFLGNTAGSYGGGIDVSFGEIVVKSSAFSGHLADRGGAVSVHGNPGEITLSNCTLSLNQATYGGAAYCSLGVLSVNNSILWGDTASGSEHEIYQSATGAVSVVSTCIAGGHAGLGNFSLDPAMIDPDGADGIAGTLDDNLRIRHPLGGASPCVDAGDNALIGGAHLQRDLDDEDRTQRPFFWMMGTPVVDCGAYEVGPIVVLYPGSLADLGVFVRRNGLTATTLGTDLATIQPGGVLEVELSSPGGTYNQGPAFLAIQPVLGGQQQAPLFALPQVHVGQSAQILPAAVPSLIAFPIPPSLAGLEVMVQGFAADPLYVAGLVVTDARLIRFL